MVPFVSSRYTFTTKAREQFTIVAVSEMLLALTHDSRKRTVYSHRSSSLEQAPQRGTNTDEERTIEQFIMARDLYISNTAGLMATYVSPDHDTDTYTDVTLAPAKAQGKDPQMRAEKITAAIQCNCDQVLKKASTQTPENNWRDKELESTRISVRQLRRKIKRGRRPQEKQCLAEKYKAERKQYFGEVRIRKAESWKKIIEVHGTISNTIMAMLSLLLPDDTEDGEKAKHLVKRRRMITPPETEDAAKFSGQESDGIIKELKMKKSSGYDNITAEILKMLYARIRTVLLQTYNKLLRAGRLPNHIEGVSSKQYGFRRGKSTELVVFDMVAKVRATDFSYDMRILLNIAGVFGNAWRLEILWQLKRRNCSANVYKVMVDYLRGRSCVYLTRHTQDERTLNKGCPQGSWLGPLHWNLVFDSLPEQELPNSCCVYGYNDNGFILLTANSRKQLEEKSEFIMSGIQEWSVSMKMKFSIEKTVCMMLKGNLRRRWPTVRFHGRPLGFVSEYNGCQNRMGVMLDNGLTFVEDSVYHVLYECGEVEDLRITELRQLVDYVAMVIWTDDSRSPGSQSSTSAKGLPGYMRIVPVNNVGSLNETEADKLKIN
ncbi:hypothetical protein PR048_014761 [Dryococelus australis]|uniref:Reverse transcriptase domain-containing protein n=1 Tax=Dryococelus australis TaxID=614101 RepID=A0ABQ9HFA4_9NEOP|nr:hypothetical protein PR048_014761 [Dryococelus australis]